MKTINSWLMFFLLPTILIAAPAPYPITIDSRIPSVPSVEAARNAQSVFRVSFKDNGTASDITGYIPFMSWATSSLASAISTSSYSVVNLTNGTVDFTFTATNVNYTPGRYIYECGIKTGTVVSVYRLGVFVIRGSPYAAGSSTVAWTTNVNWSQIIGAPTTLAGYGITDAVKISSLNTGTVEVTSTIDAHQGFKVDGTAGYNGTVTNGIGSGSTNIFTINGGIITAVSTP